MSMNRLFSSVLHVFLIANVVVNVHKTGFVSAKKDVTTDILPPCAACKVLIGSFKRGLEKTKNGNYEGGDSHYEEEKMRIYSKSEVRLIEIQEGLCKEVERGQMQCHAQAEKLEEILEEWFHHHQESHPDPYEWFCIEKTKSCCPKDHFGPNCTQCPGYPKEVCGNNGNCTGAGTRKGNGECICSKGYEKPNCSSCSPGYHVSYKDENMLLCLPCHAACDGPCSGPSPSHCEKCATGWFMLEGKGCHDIDECIKSKKPCPTNHFCVNNDGSYTCLACDRACNGCTGDGPDMCKKCAENYVKQENLCINAETIDVKKKENFARYATYLGLGVATCIILQKNVYVAGFIGIFVGVYIAMSEYTVTQHSTDMYKT